MIIITSCYENDINNNYDNNNDHGNNGMRVRLFIPYYCKLTSSVMFSQSSFNVVVTFFKSATLTEMTLS